MGRLRVFFDGPLSGEVNMQRDRDLLAAQRPEDDPVLRLYRWQPAAVTIGYNQDFDNFDGQALARAGFGLVQRPTGGRAIFHADELTYSLTGASPGPLFGNTLHEVYMKINEALVLFLKGLGLAAEISGGEGREARRSLVCFQSAGKYEIRVRGRKLVGSAQRRTGGVFLQHGSILTGKRHLLLPEFLQADPTGDSLNRQELAALTTDLGQELNRELNDEDLAAMERTLATCFSQVLALEPTIESRAL